MLREEGMAAQVGVVVVRVVWTLGVELLVVVVCGAFTVHGPEEPQDEHDHPQHHAAEGERLQAALGRGQEGCGAAGHDEEGSDEDCSVVQGRHPPVLRDSNAALRSRSRLRADGQCHSGTGSRPVRSPCALTLGENKTTRGSKISQASVSDLRSLLGFHNSHHQMCF